MAPITKVHPQNLSEAAIDRFLSSPPHNKPFSIIPDPAFTEANKVFDAFVKDLRKMGKIAGALCTKEQSRKSS